jgi:acyl-coenzyme A thioesterase PaaI-like protein
MVKAATAEGLRCVTAELNVKFKKPALIETEYLIKGKIKEKRKRIIVAEGSVISGDNKVIASAESKLFLV